MAKKVKTKYTASELKEFEKLILEKMKNAQKEPVSYTHLRAHET